MPTPLIRKAMILCAGLGTRLRPITHQIPKPLVPVLNLPNLMYQIALLESAGVEEIAINLHHLPDAIENFLNEATGLKTRFHFLHEPILLGTGGGVKNAEKFFGRERFILMNCDFVSNVNLKPFVERHITGNRLATMLLIEDTKRQPLYSAVGVNQSGNLVQLPKAQLETPQRIGIFTGIHILEAETLENLRSEPCGINDILYPKLMSSSAARVSGEFLGEEYWLDTGDIPTYFETSMELLKRFSEADPFLKDLFKKHQVEFKQELAAQSVPSLVAEDCQLGNTTLTKQMIIGEGCLIRDHLKLERSIVLANSTVTQNIFECLVYGDLAIPIHA